MTTPSDQALLEATPGMVADATALADLLARRRDQAVLVHRVTTRITADRELGSILEELVDQSMAVFEADRALVSVAGSDGFRATVSRGLSAAWVAATRRLPPASLGTLAFSQHRALASVHYASDPRGADMRELVLAEGFESLAVAPLIISDQPAGFLALYHDTPRPYDADDLAALQSVADHAGIALSRSQAFAQQARWAAQLGAIHELGGRLSGLATVQEVAEATVSKLNEIIEYHSVRVYRVEGEDVLPIAWRGERESYGTETVDELRVRLGEGITGWVAEHGVGAYLPDASRDPRTKTIPGSSRDDDESMLAVPMVQDGRVLGVIVLSKEGLDQFSDDVRRLLEIFASLAGQAMVNAQVREQRLRENEARLRAVVDSVEDAIVTVDRACRIVDWNAGAERVFGFTRQRMLGRRLGSLLAPGHGAHLEAASRALMAGEAGPRRMTESQGRRRGRQAFPAEVSLSAWQMDGEAHVTAWIRDVTERQRAEAALRASEARHRELVEHVPVIYYQAEPGPLGRMRYVSPRIESLLGYRAEDWLERPELWSESIHPDDRDLAQAEEAREWEMPDGHRSVSDYRMVTRDGQVRWVRDEASVVRPEDGSAPYWSGFLADITERKALEEQLQHQAFHDPLTGLANRALFTDRVDHAVARSRREGHSLAVLFLDIDDFKTVNDGFGHIAGDGLLVAIAGRLLGCLRLGDTAARLGGDEFAVLLEDLADAEDASRIAERIREALSAPVVVSGQDVTLGTSVGIAVPLDDREGAAELLRNADAAMYAAKRSGKGCWRLFQPDMHAAAVRRLRLAADVRRALANGEFEVHYQPTVRLHDGAISGFEALIRLRRRRGGLATPAEVIDSAEETGQIIAIGRLVLTQACLQAQAWRDAFPEGPERAMSVNVSARQVAHESFLQDVADALAVSGLEPASLVLEITESVAMDQSQASVERLHALKGLGVRLAVDDFGTGYSSLSYLQRLPVDVLKIDKSFIDTLDHDEAASPLAGVIVRMGQALDLEVVAEGVETERQAQALQRMGCQQAQGYHFARPAGPHAIEGLLRRSAVLPLGRTDEPARSGPDTRPRRGRRSPPRSRSRRAGMGFP